MSIRTEQVQQRAADIGAATSIGGTTWAWIGTATEVMQFVVLVVSAVAGIASAYYYITKARRENKSSN